MKKYFILIATVIATSLIFWSCGSDEGSSEPTNQSPTCTITSPSAYSGFFSGDTISVRINVDDTDGDIKEVRYFLNDFGVDSSQTFPYSTEISTLDLPLGGHLIKIVVEDDGGAETEVELPFGIKPKNPTNLLISQNNVYTFTLNWTGNDENADGFKIECKIDDGTFSEISTTIATTFIDSTVSKKGYGTVYYQIRSYKDIYNSDYASNSFAISFPAPYNLNFTKVDISSIKLSWLESSIGEDGFKIDKKVGASDWIILYSSVGENILTFTDIYAEINENLQYRVYGYKGLNTSSIAETSVIVNTFPAPSNLMIQPSSVISATLTWKDNSIGEDMFDIERKLSTETEYIKIAEVTGSDVTIKTWEDTILDPSKLYDYRIKAIKGEIFTEYTTLNGYIPFKAPSNLIATQISITSANLTWSDNSIGEDRFEIERKLSTATTFTKIGEFPGSNTTTKNWADTTLEPSKTYDFRVKAVHETNSSTYAEKTGYINAFNAPTSLSATQTSITSANLTWSDNSIGEDRFEIERKISTETTYIKVGELLGSNTTSKTWADTTLEPSKTYDFRVKAVHGTNSSAYVTKTGYETLPAPSSLTPLPLSDTSIILDWTDNTNGEDGFKIDRKVGSTGSWITNYNTVGANVKTFTDTGLTTGTIYFYRVRAFYSTYFSSYTTEVNVATIGTMIELPSGSFSMGSTFSSAEQPIHTVNITRPYYLGKYEVTQKEWQNVIGSNPASGWGVGDNYPVYYVSWYSVLVYCNKRSLNEGLTPCYTISGSTNPTDWGSIPVSYDDPASATWEVVTCDFNAKGYRLPTEAEWEYAAKYTDNRTYPWGETTPTSTLCNYNSNVGATSAVGSYPTGNSSLGLCDMAGNVFEWCWDWYGSYPSTAQTNPSEPASSLQIQRDMRGGGCSSPYDRIRCSYRFFCPPHGTGGNYGFRIVRTK